MCVGKAKMTFCSENKVSEKLHIYKLLPTQDTSITSLESMYHFCCHCCCPSAIVKHFKAKWGRAPCCPTAIVKHFKANWGMAPCCPSAIVKHFMAKWGRAPCCPSAIVKHFKAKWGRAPCCPSAIVKHFKAKQSRDAVLVLLWSTLGSIFFYEVQLSRSLIIIITSHK